MEAPSSEQLAESSFISVKKTSEEELANDIITRLAMTSAKSSLSERLGPARNTRVAEGSEQSPSYAAAPALCNASIMEAQGEATKQEQADMEEALRTLRNMHACKTTRSYDSSSINMCLMQLPEHLLAAIPKSVLLTFASDVLQQLWRKLPDSYKRDPEMSQYEGCLLHWCNTGPDVVEGGPPPRKDCRGCREEEEKKKKKLTL